MSRLNMKDIPADEIGLMKATHTGLFKKLYNGDNGTIRWLDSGQIIEFTKSTIYTQNGEFEINGSSSQKIWFSQLTAVFVNIKNKNVVLAEITFCDGSSLVMRNLDVTDFWEKVRGRKFRVKASSVYKLNEKANKYKELGSFSNIFNYLNSLLNAKKYDELADSNMIYPGTMYELKEI
ncbi:MAG: hypothetical protein LKI18_04195 [Prevotella sp.]|jgi:hypothetical protein|nr:hypothetical protein [Prevotella sp.]